jgi:hypothetical protein
VLEVVQKQYELAAAQEAAQVVGCADRLRNLGGHETRVGERAKGNPEDTVRDRADELGRDLKREPSLTRAARPGDRDEPSIAEQLDELGHCSLASEERARRDWKIRGVERPERRELAVTELEEAFRLGQVLQSMLAEVAEMSVGAEEVARRPRENDLAAVCRCGDARGAVHIEADVALLSDERLTRVNPDANANQPVAQAVTDLVGSGNGVRGSRERCEERVTLCVHLDSRMPAKSAANNVAVGGEKVRVRVAVLVEQLCRARDVGEEERNGAAREILSHAELIMPRDRSPV